MKEELEKYKNKVHILEKQLEQAERHILELKKMVDIKDKIIDYHIKEVTSNRCDLN